MILLHDKGIPVSDWRNKWVIYLISQSDFKLNALKYIMLLHFGLFPAMIQFITFNTTTNFFCSQTSICGNIHFKTKKNKKRQFYFVHPVDPSRRVYIFADVPHMLKLLRNHFLDDGFKVPASDGKKIIDGPLVTFTKEDIEPLIESKNELK